MSPFLLHINKLMSHPSVCQALLSINVCCLKLTSCPPPSVIPLNSTEYSYGRGGRSVGQSQRPHISIGRDKSALTRHLNHQSLIDLVCVSMFWTTRACSKPPGRERGTWASPPCQLQMCPIPVLHNRDLSLQGILSREPLK